MSRKGAGRLYSGMNDSDSRGRAHWGHEDVLNLVTFVGEFWQDFTNGIRKKKYIWKDIASKMEDEGFPVSGEECDRKWRNLKIRYMAVLEKRMNGEKAAHRIDYFDGMHSFLKDDPTVIAFLEQRNIKQNCKTLLELGEEAMDTSVGDDVDWADTSVQMLLDLLLEFKDWFTDNDWDDNSIWETISEQMKLEGHQPSASQCRNKWYSLAQEFEQHKAEAEASGSVPLWQFYTRVRHVVAQVGMPPPPKKVVAKTPSKPAPRRGGRRGRKRTRSSFSSRPPAVKREVQDFDDDFDDFINTDTSYGSKKNSNDTIQAADVREICQRLENIEDNMAICQRLDRLEAQLDTATEHQRAQKQTNSLLSQVLAELSSLRHTLGSQYAPKVPGQEPADLSSGITIVVPQSQQL